MKKQLTPFQDFVMDANARVADQDWRLGQALMNCLDTDLLKKYTGGEFDCFLDDAKVGMFLNEVYHEFQPKKFEAIVWAKEPRWYKRHVVLDCSITNARLMTSAELDKHIITHLDVLDVEEVDNFQTEYDLDSMVEA